MQPVTGHGCQAEPPFLGHVRLQGGENIFLPLQFKAKFFRCHQATRQLPDKILIIQLGMDVPAKDLGWPDRETVGPGSTVVQQRLAAWKESTEMSFMDGRVVREDRDLEVTVVRVGVLVDHFQDKFLVRSNALEWNKILVPFSLLRRHTGPVDFQLDDLGLTGKFHPQPLFSTAKTVKSLHRLLAGKCDDHPEDRLLNNGRFQLLGLVSSRRDLQCPVLVKLKGPCRIQDQFCWGPNH